MAPTLTTTLLILLWSWCAELVSCVSQSGVTTASPFIVNYLIAGLPQAPLGSTHIILSFIECATPTIPAAGDPAWLKYAVAEFAALTVPARTTLLSLLHAHGTRLMASRGGAAARHSIYSTYDARALGVRAAEYVIELGLDGLDVDLEGWGNDPRGYAFLKNATAGAFETFAAAASPALGPYTLSHAPEMPDFWRGTLYAVTI